MKREYKVYFVINPAIGPGEIEKITNKITHYLDVAKCEAVNINKIGEKKLAYEINKDTKGYYTAINFKCEPSSIAELSRMLQLDDNIIRFMVNKEWPSKIKVPQEVKTAAVEKKVI